MSNFPRRVVRKRQEQPFPLTHSHIHTHMHGRKREMIIIMKRQKERKKKKRKKSKQEDAQVNKRLWAHKKGGGTVKRKRETTRYRLKEYDCYLHRWKRRRRRVSHTCLIISREKRRGVCAFGLRNQRWKQARGSLFSPPSLVTTVPSLTPRVVLVIIIGKKI